MSSAQKIVGGDLVDDDTQQATVPADIDSDFGGRDQNAADDQRAVVSASDSPLGGETSEVLAPSGSMSLPPIPLSGEGDLGGRDVHYLAVASPDTDRGDQERCVPPWLSVSPICDLLRELHRNRQDLHRAEKSLTLQIKAKCRRLCHNEYQKQTGKELTKGQVTPLAERLYRLMLGKKAVDHDLPEDQSPSVDSQDGDGGEDRAEREIQSHDVDALASIARAISEPFITARAILIRERKAYEKRMAKQAEQLPVWETFGKVRGFGIGCLGAIVGECGDLGNYSSVAKLWKRLGLAVINGERQRCIVGTDDAKKELAKLHGYSPSRRAVIWNVGQTMFKAQSQRVDKNTGEVKIEAGEYRRVYDERKAYELARAPEMKPIFAHRRATRYMEKRIVRDLWRAWRDCSSEEAKAELSPKVRVPSPTNTAETVE